MLRIAYIDDNEAYLEDFKDRFAKDYVLFLESDPSRAINEIEAFNPDSVILDVHMPKMDGTTLYKEIKDKAHNTPVFFISSDDSNDNIIKSLSIGAEDFLSRDLSDEVLKLKINRSVSNRSRSILHYEGLLLNKDTVTVHYHSEPVDVTLNEYKILSFLMERPGTFLNKRELLEFIWPEVKVLERTINTHLTNLRKKINHYGFNIVSKRTGVVQLIANQ